MERWTTRSLGSIAGISAGNSAPQAARLFEGGTHPFFRTADAGRVHFGDIHEAADHLNDDGIKGLRLFPRETILFPKSGASTFLNHRVMLGSAGYVASHLATIVADESVVEPRFLLYFLATISAQDLIQDHAYPSLNLPSIGAIRVPVPPLAQQKHLVAILDEAFAAIATARANTEQNLRNAREVFESYLQSIFAQRGVRWERVQLKILLERGWIEGHQDGNHGENYPRKSEFLSAGVPYISANCIDDDRVNMSRAKYLSPRRATLIRTGVARDNDVLFAHNATVGPVVVLHTDDEPVILGTSLTYYRCNAKHILPEYLAHYMRSSGFRTQYLAVMAQSTRNQVPITKQREFHHVIPPVDEQRSLIRTLNGIFDDGQRLQATCQRKLAALDALKQSLLHQAFTGAL